MKPLTDPEEFKRFNEAMQEWAEAHKFETDVSWVREICKELAPEPDTELPRDSEAWYAREALYAIDAASALIEQGHVDAAAAEAFTAGIAVSQIQRKRHTGRGIKAGIKRGTERGIKRKSQQLARSGGLGRGEQQRAEKRERMDKLPRLIGWYEQSSELRFRYRSLVSFLADRLDCDRSTAYRYLGELKRLK